MLSRRMDDSTTDPLDRLDRAIVAYIGYREDPGGVRVDDFLAGHEDLRDLLEPMLESKPSATESAATVAGVDRYLGGYQVTREIGRGGMGVVYEAIDTELGRRVALKVLPAHLTLAPHQIERFRAEAASAARLHHPSIVPIYAVGEVDGTHYFAMEFVEGETLADLLARRDGSADTPLGIVPNASRAGESAEVIAQIAEVLEFAHERGVVHRDVKPQNLMVEPEGRVRVVDFGLAKDATQESLTRTGGLVCTPHYASPEQSTGEQTDARSDVFALGVVLYELLTGTRPFDGDTQMQVLVAVATCEPPSLRVRGRRVPRDLEVICNKALEKDPADRYQSAGAMAADLRRFLGHEPIEALPPRTVSRIWKAVRRRKTLAYVTLAVVLVSGVATTAWYLHEQGQHADRLAQMGRDQQLVARLVDALTSRPVHDRPGHADAVRQSVSSAVALAEDLIERAGDGVSPTLLASAGRLMGHAASFWILMGVPDKARAFLARGIAFRSMQLERKPEDSGARMALAALYCDRSALIGASPAERELDLDRSIEVWRQVVDGKPAPDTALRARAGLAFAIAMQARLCLGQFGQQAEAARLARLADELWQGAGDLGVDSAVAYPRLVTALGIADIAMTMGQIKDAEQRYRDVIVRIKQSPKRLERSWRNMEFRARAGAGRAAVLTGRSDQAITELTAAIEAGAALVRDFPEIPALAEELALTRYFLAQRLIDGKELSAAVGQLAACEFPAEHASFAMRHLRLKIDASLLLVRNQQAKMSVASIEQELVRIDAGFESLLESHPGAAAVAASRAQVFANCGVLADQGGDPARAERWMRRALDSQKRALAVNKAQPDYRRFVRIQAYNLARIYARGRRSDEMAALATELATLLPNDGEARVMAARILGQVVLQADRDDPAIEQTVVGHLRRALELGIPVKKLESYDELQSIRRRAAYQKLVENRPPK